MQIIKLIICIKASNLHVQFINKKYYMAEKKPTRNPWLFIPTQYFAEGLPFILVNQLSVAMFKSLGASNEFIGITSLLYIPWSIKFLWSPFVESKGTKRGWVLAMQALLSILFILLAVSMQLSHVIIMTVILFIIISFLSATHDIATDGFYLFALDAKNQAFFTGIRSTFYRLAMIFTGGTLLMIAGASGSQLGSVSGGWTVSFSIAAIIFLALFFYHKRVLPYPKDDVPASSVASSTKIPYRAVFIQYFTQKRIIVILTYILLYRFGEGMLLKMVQPFMMDTIEKGGLGISLSQVGFMYGTLGVLALVVGGILGGLAIKHYSLRRLIWLMAVAMNLPNLFYVYLAYFQPQSILMIDYSFLSPMSTGMAFDFHPIVQACIIIEQFGYGFGFTAFMVYLLYISKGKYRTSFYAISTGIMAIGIMVPGFISGFVQSQVGYLGLFIASCVMTVPGMLTISFLPMEFGENK